jgi:hypothetical protein
MVIDGEKYTINETRTGESDILRLPMDAKKELNVHDEYVIQNSRLKEIFSGSVITHSYENNNITVYEKYIVSSSDRRALSYEVFMNNESLFTSSGIFKNNSTYDIVIEGEYVTSIKNLDDNVTFDYENNTVDIVFKDINSTSIKQPVREYQGNFLNFDFDNYIKENKEK